LAGAFFERELGGEQPPTIETMQSLYDESRELLARRPWQRMFDRNLVLVQDRASNTMSYCSILGNLGEVYALHANLGEAGYRGILKIQSGEVQTAGEFLAVQRSVFVEFVRLGELTPPDRGLLKALGDPLKRGAFVPMFRSLRPGYHPWYVTESEARSLVPCLRAVNQVWDQLQRAPEASYWIRQGEYPVVAGGEIGLARPPAPPEPMLPVPALDEQRLARIRKRKLKPHAPLQVDHFYTAAKIGKPNERKMLFRGAMAIDAETAFAFPPEAASPEDATGDLLHRVVLTAMETGGILPREIQVGRSEFRALLAPLGQALGVPVKLHKSLPALDFAKTELLRMMGDLL
jgi:hypothetical protein